MTSTSQSTGFADFHELGAAAAQLTRIFAVEHDSSTSYEGHDPTETVQVVVDSAGVVTDVRVERGWQNKIDSRRFGATVLEAIEVAGRDRLSAWATRVADAESEEDEEPPPRRPSQQPPEPFEINPSRALMDHLLTLLHQVGTAVNAPGPQPVTGESAGGHVTVTLQGKEIVDIDLEFRWIGLASGPEIASELRGAFAAAYAAARSAESARPETGPIAELRALTADPNEFVASLFGIRRT